MIQETIVHTHERITNDGGRRTKDERSTKTDHTPRTTDANPTLGNLLKSPWRRYAASALSAALLVFCFPRLHLRPLVWVACLPLLMGVLSEPRAGRAYLLGALTGVGFLAGSVYWFVGVMKTYGRVPTGLALAAMVPFLIVFSSFWGVFGLVEAWVARRSVARALVLAPFLWVALELARTYYFITGFPWNLLGYAVQATGLRQLASVTGVYGLSFLAVATSALLAQVVLPPRRRVAVTTLLWLIMLFVLDGVLMWRTMPAVLPLKDAYLLQPNVPLSETVVESWAPWRDQTELNRLVTLSLEAACKGLLPPGQEPNCSSARAMATDSRPLIVWSENPAPFFFNHDAIFTGAMEGLARATHAYVLFNTVIFAGQNNTLPKNSAVVVDPNGRQILQYDKIHLVPFGEYVPSWLDGLVGKITNDVGDYVPGTNYQTAQTPDGSIGVFICYEDIFPQIVRKLVPKGPGVLANISNDSWYGDSSARDQHSEMARLRAIENRRFLLRSTNDGLTAVIDPYGEIVGQLPRYEQAALTTHFAFLSERTFYTRYGDIFAWLCVAVAGVVVGYTVLRGQ